MQQFIVQVLKFFVFVICFAADSFCHSEVKIEENFVVLLAFQPPMTES